MKKRKLLCIMLALALTVANGYPVMGAKKASLAFKKLTLTEGQTKKIQIKNKNKKAVYKFFSSSKKKISVNNKGVITARKQGKAKITVKEQLKQGSKVSKCLRKVGTITVTCKKKQAARTSATPQNSPASGSNSEVPLPTAVPQASAPGSPQQSPQGSAQVTPAPTESPSPTPDLYTKKVMSLSVSDTDLYSVDGNTCHVDMQYFKGEASGDYFNGSTLGEGTTVIKDYKEGKKQLCARYILSGTDADGKKCSIFIEDNGTADDVDNIVTTPIIITDSDSLAWLETADLQGRVADHGNGEKTIDLMWNESNTEPVAPREVIRPDESLSYPNEIFTFAIDIGSTTSVKGSTGNASMIHFGASSDCANFKGKIVSDCVDTRLKYNGQVETLSARYILSGTDANGNPCNIYVENNGIDDNGMVTEPVIITDNPDYAWVERAKLHGTVSWSPKLTIHVATTN